MKKIITIITLLIVFLGSLFILTLKTKKELKIKQNMHDLNDLELTDIWFSNIPPYKKLADQLLTERGFWKDLKKRTQKRKQQEKEYYKNRFQH